MERELRSARFHRNSDDFKAQNHWYFRRWPTSGKRHFRHWKWWKADDGLRWPSTDERWIPIILDVATTINFWLGIAQLEQVLVFVWNQVFSRDCHSWANIVLLLQLLDRGKFDRKCKNLSHYSENKLWKINSGFWYQRHSQLQWYGKLLSLLNR